jgi:hypothetical protein
MAWASQSFVGSARFYSDRGTGGWADASALFVPGAEYDELR